MKLAKRNIFHISFYAILTFVLVLLIFNDHFLLGTFLGYLRWFFVISLFIFFVFSQAKKVKLLASLFVLALILQWGYVQFTSYQLPKTRVNKPEKLTSLLSYNLFFKNKYPNQIINNINKISPDILTVQELTPNWTIWLNARLNKHYKYKKLKPLNGTHGIGIYSKYPILKNQYLFNVNGLPFAQITVINVNNEKLLVCNTHLASPAIAVENPDNFLDLYRQNWQLRRKQYETIQFTLQSKTYQSISKQVFIGDLNTLKNDPLYTLIRKQWDNLYAISGNGPGFNFPNSARTPFPLTTLDYILIRGNIRPVSARVIEGGSSDHLGVFGEIVL